MAWVHHTRMRCLNWFHSVLPRPPQPWDAQNADPFRAEYAEQMAWTFRLLNYQVMDSSSILVLLFKARNSELGRKCACESNFFKVVLVCQQITKPAGTCMILRAHQHTHGTCLRHPQPPKWFENFFITTIGCGCSVKVFEWYLYDFVRQIPSLPPSGEFTVHGCNSHQFCPGLYFWWGLWGQFDSLRKQKVAVKSRYVNFHPRKQGLRKNSTRWAPSPVINVVIPPINGRINE